MAKMHMLHENCGGFEMLLTLLASGCPLAGFLCYSAAFDSAANFAAWGPPLAKKTTRDVSRLFQPYRLRLCVLCAAYKS
jgi:hypothetical protein